ncbi:MAG: hypothetical protein FJ009_15015 [Chloroflexi bacterium]|nr:hypothetical protein [Chloroflexota bacterium]
MTETTYIIDLTPDGKNRYRHRHVVSRRRIVEFSLQYEAFLENKWHAIVRYDTAHGFAHRDVIHPDGTEGKTSFQHWSYEQVLTFGERDLKQNWLAYRATYLNELLSFQKGT